MLFKPAESQKGSPPPLPITRSIPLLPLRDIIVFPHMVVPLFVGREKSIKALEESMRKEKEILLSAQMKAKTNDPNPDEIFRVGSLSTIIQLLRLPDGTVKVLVEGKQRARIKRFIETDPFFRVEIEDIRELTESSPETEALMRSIHTAFETCGACPWEHLEVVVAHADLVLYDLKLIDEQEHLRWTGASNRQILQNAGRLAGMNVQVRVPLIPGITDSEANLRGLFAFMAESGLQSAALLPYNPAAGAKYEWLGREYGIEGAPQTRAELALIVGMARELGVETEVV